MLYEREWAQKQSIAAGSLLVIITLAGVSANVTLFSFLMVVCLGAPGLLLLLDTLLA